MIVTEICVSCNDEKNCNEINYETMKCNDCSISMPKKYIRDIRFCQHCYYFKYSSFWFDVLSKNMCYECASSDTYDTKEKQEQIKNYRHIICKLPAIQELPEERPRYKRKYEKSENDTQNQNQNVKHKRVRKVITQVCTVCLEEKSSKYWCNASKNITCPVCYYKEKKINPRINLENKEHVFYANAAKKLKCLLTGIIMVCAMIVINQKKYKRKIKKI